MTEPDSPKKPAMTVVEVDNVSFRFPTAPYRLVLDSVSLTIEHNDFLGIIGPNGGGKTTLLRLILGLEQPTAGKVRVLGKPPRRIRHRIGYVPQHSSVDPTVPATALDVVLMGRLAQSRWGATFSNRHRQAALDAMAQTSTADLASRPMRALSGGQRQRVLIARAIASDACLLLLDEPTSAVDLHIERELVELLHVLNTTMPIVMVSHDVAMVSSYLTKVALINCRLAMHTPHEIDSELIASQYEGHVASIEAPGDLLRPHRHFHGAPHT